MPKKIPVYITLSVLALVVLGGLTVFLMSDNWTERGTIGDSFGMTNALFSGLAFAGVIYAILLQQQELSLQREELRMTREELSKSASAQLQSAETQRQLAQLNAYTALITYKLSEARDARTNALSPSETLEFRTEWNRRFQERRTECNRIEAHIENILFRVGGQLSGGSPKTFEESVEYINQLAKKDSSTPLSEEEDG